MAVVEVTAKQFAVFTRISSIFASIFLVSTLIYQIKHIQEVKQNGKFKYYSTLFASFMMIPTAIIYFITEILWITITDHHNHTECYVFYAIEIISFSSFKLFLYLSLAVRLVESNPDSRIYSIKYLIIWQITIVISIIGVDIIAFIFVKLDLSESPCMRTYDIC